MKLPEFFREVGRKKAQYVQHNSIHVFLPVYCNYYNAG